MRPRTDPTEAALLRAMTELAGAGPATGVMLLLADVERREWHSITLSGCRHTLEVVLAGPEQAVAAARSRLEKGLADRDLPLAGRFVADIGIEACGGPTTAQALTVSALVIAD